MVLFSSIDICLIHYDQGKIVIIHSFYMYRPILGSDYSVNSIHCKSGLGKQVVIFVCKADYII